LARHIADDPESLRLLQAMAGERGIDLGKPPSVEAILRLGTTLQEQMATFDLSRIPALQEAYKKADRANTRLMQEYHKLVNDIARAHDDVSRAKTTDTHRAAQENLEILRSKLIAAQDAMERGQVELKTLRDELIQIVEPASRMMTFNNLLRDALVKSGLETDRFLLPHGVTEKGRQIGLVGLTMHGGEQVAKYPPHRLLDDIEIELAVSDRIGHGVILGMRFGADDDTVRNETMARMGFTKQSNGDWFRESDGTRYRPTDLDGMEKRRIELLQTARDRNIAIEVPPTSNIVLNNLGIGKQHPLKHMMQDADPPPPLRVAIATDNPAIHLTDVHSEMALLMATGVVDWPQAVRIGLEGFASRLGARPVERAGERMDIQERMVEMIVTKTTNFSDRINILRELAERYPHVAALYPNRPDVMTSMDDQTFEDWLRPYVKAAMGVPSTGS
jgi:hypothetical protein